MNNGGMVLFDKCGGMVLAISQRRLIPTMHYNLLLFQDLIKFACSGYMHEEVYYTQINIKGPNFIKAYLYIDEHPYYGYVQKFYCQAIPRLFYRVVLWLTPMIEADLPISA